MTKMYVPLIYHANDHSHAWTQRSDMESGMKCIMQHMKVYISDLPKEMLIQGPKIYKALVLNDWLY